MPSFDVTIYLKTGATVKIMQEGDSGSTVKSALDKQIDRVDECTLSFDQNKDSLNIKNPRENVIGYYIDRKP
jgi:hypothetical protein